MSGGHAWLPPSGADAWVECAVWPHMNAAFPETEPIPASQEGDTAHVVLREYLTTGRMPETGFSVPPHGLQVTTEMQQGAELFRDALPREVTSDARWWVEEQLPPGRRIHPQFNYGTPDTAAFQWPNLWILDYKYGHDPVEVFENWQGINYAALLMDLLGIDGVTDQQMHVHLVIVQPRASHRDGPVRRWKVSGANIRAHINKLHLAAERALGPQPLARTGPHCKYCPGRHACQTFEKVAQAAMDVAFGTDPHILTPHQVGLQLRFLKRAEAAIKARVTGLEEQAIALKRQGQTVPFFRMGAGAGKTVWLRPYEEIKALGEAMQVKLTKDALVTPLQAIAAGLAPDMVESFSQAIPGSMQLMEDDGSNARRVFGKD